MPDSSSLLPFISISLFVKLNDLGRYVCPEDLVPLKGTATVSPAGSYAHTSVRRKLQPFVFSNASGRVEIKDMASERAIGHTNIMGLVYIFINLALRS
jgi:hypothetical protein